MSPQLTPIREFPNPLPVFPLPGVLLLPHTELPLHIFESRYRLMIEQALRCHRMFGIIQPTGVGQAQFPKLFRVGCLGLITSHRQTSDGRFYILLKGLSRFLVLRELRLDDAGYRRVIPDYSPFVGDLDVPVVLPGNNLELLEKLDGYVEAKQLFLNREVLDQLSYGALIGALSISLPFDSEDKQALLEAANVEERAELLMKLLDMGRYGSSLAGQLPQ